MSGCEDKPLILKLSHNKPAWDLRYECIWFSLVRRQEFGFFVFFSTQNPAQVRSVSLQQKCILIKSWKKVHSKHMYFQFLILKYHVVICNIRYAYIRKNAILMHWSRLCLPLCVSLCMSPTQHHAEVYALGANHGIRKRCQKIYILISNWTFIHQMIHLKADKAMVFGLQSHFHTLHEGIFKSV